MIRVLLLFGLLAACASPPSGIPEAGNPFPISDVNDAALVDNFQSLAIDPRFSPYALVQVQRGRLDPAQIYDVPFQAPARVELLFVVGCGQGCTSPRLRLYDARGNRVANPTYGNARAYIALDVGTSARPFRATVSTPDCQQTSCSAYWALYAKTPS